MPAVLTVGELARILGVSRETVSRWCREGIIKCARLGKRGWYFIPYDEAQRVIKEFSERRKHM